MFTSLPPNVEGEIKFNFKLEISKINLKVDEAEDKKQLPKKNLKHVKSKQTEQNNSNLIAHVQWWGEDDSKGSIFRPRVLHNNKSQGNDRKIQTVAKYIVRSGMRQFSAYLNGKFKKKMNLPKLNK